MSTKIAITQGNAILMAKNRRILMNTMELNHLYNTLEALEEEIEKGDVARALKTIEPLKNYLIDEILLSYLINGK
ncbi:MAG: hypothetical protein HQK52_19585 [Oligoflexia bacterium]|nr:hypothetical protein [Oligoflexia bacterium]